MIEQWTDAQILAFGKTDTLAKVAELEARTTDRRRAFLASFRVEFLRASLAALEATLSAYSQADYKPCFTSRKRKLGELSRDADGQVLEHANWAYHPRKDSIDRLRAAERALGQMGGPITMLKETIREHDRAVAYIWSHLGSVYPEGSPGSHKSPSGLSAALEAMWQKANFWLPALAEPYWATVNDVRRGLAERGL